MTYFPEEVVEHIFSFLDGHCNRNAISAVSKVWYRIERLCRRTVFVGNCYAVSPERVMERFPEVNSLIVKGKPHFVDFNMVPLGWGGYAEPWIEAAVAEWPGLEKLRLKRMVVTDEDLGLLAQSFCNFKVLVLDSCEGFSTNGLAAIAIHCRHLRKLDFLENEVEDHGLQWLNCFPNSCISLVSLNFACLKGEVNAGVLERLVARSPKLKSLRLNHAVSAETLAKLLVRAPQLVDLGTGSFTLDHRLETYHGLLNAVIKCKSFRSLSGFWDASPHCFLAVYPICWKLTDLNLSYATTIKGADIIKLICQCHML